MQTTIWQLGTQADTGSWISAAAGIGGAMLGALVGGLISTKLQKREHLRVDELRSNDRLAHQRSAAELVLLKLIEILSDVARLKDHLETQVQGKDPAKDAWSYVVPMFVPSNKIEWEREELSLLFDLGLHEELNLIVNLPAVRNQLHSTMISYTDKREQLWRMLPESAYSMGDLRMTPGQVFWTQRLRTEMQDLVEYMLSSAPRAFDEAHEGLQAMHVAFRKALKIRFKLNFDAAVVNEVGGGQ